MKHSINFYLSSAIALAAVFATVTGTSANAQERVRWKMQSAFGSQLAHVGSSGARFSKTIDAMTDGNFNIKFEEPGALVPALECFDAVAKGSVDACWTSPAYHAGKIPAAAFFASVPFGPDFGEFLAWKWFGDGNKFRDREYAKHGLVAFDSVCHGAETSGWFKEEVKGVKSLEGMKIRFSGLGARVLQKLGVSTQLIAGPEIYPALERGVIDATEYSMPSIDIGLGLHQIANFNYYPGWHQQASCLELLVNKDTFEALPKSYQKILEVAAGESVAYIYAETEAMNPAAMEAMKTKHGVTNVRWSDEDLAVLERAWRDVVKEQSDEDPLFKEVADNYLAFRKNYQLWGSAQALDSTYLD